MTWRVLVLAALVSSACGGTMSDAGPDSEVDADVDESAGCPGGCHGDEVCREGVCVPRGSLCDDVVCPDGQRCLLGQCVADDPCADVVCPNAGDVCQRGVCISGGADSDGDGVIASEDCDDFDVTVHPGAEEACNGVDDDCDTAIDESYDLDGDGFSGCEATPAMLFDCDDTSAWVNPAASERCNGADDTCDPEVDEGFDCVQGREVDCATSCNTTGRGVCDDDCTVPGPADCTPPAEVCNGADDDCDGAIDDGFERPQCPLTGAFDPDAAACDAACAVSHACTSRVNAPNASGSLSYTSRCTMRVAAAGAGITFYQQTYDSEYGCSWGEDTIGTITLAEATATGSLSYTSRCTMRIVASGSTITFSQQTYDSEYGCSWGEETIGTISLSGATASGSVSYTSRCTMRVAASGTGITFYQQTYDSEYGCSWGEETIGTITLAGVTTWACPAGGSFPCSGDPPSCTQTAACAPVVDCE